MACSRLNAAAAPREGVCSCDGFTMLPPTPHDGNDQKCKEEYATNTTADRSTNDRSCSTWQVGSQRRIVKLDLKSEMLK
jgi:hypothetical protein